MLELRPVLQTLYAYKKIEDINYDTENINISCLNPEHDDDTPSFSVNLLFGMFYCHGCEISGNYKKLVFMLETERLGREPDPWELVLAKADIALNSVEFEYDQVISIEQRAGRSTKKDTRALFLSEEFFFGLPKAPWSVIQQHYLYERGFGRSILQEFDVRLNYASEHSVVIPVYQQGIYRGYTARKSKDCRKDEAKYWHSPGMHKNEIVFGNLELGTILIVEGPLDKIMAHQLGFDNVACTFGWSMSNMQANHIKKYAKKIIDGQDNDEKGEEGARKSRELIPEVEHQRFVFPKNVKDIGSMYEHRQMFELNMYAPSALCA